jgi:hypothetical protein
MCEEPHRDAQERRDADGGRTALDPQAPDGRRHLGRRVDGPLAHRRGRARRDREQDAGLDGAAALPPVEVGHEHERDDSPRRVEVPGHGTGEEPDEHHRTELERPEGPVSGHEVHERDPGDEHDPRDDLPVPEVEAVREPIGVRPEHPGHPGREGLVVREEAALGHVGQHIGDPREHVAGTPHRGSDPEQRTGSGDGRDDHRALAPEHEVHDRDGGDDLDQRGHAQRGPDDPPLPAGGREHRDRERQRDDPVDLPEPQRHRHRVEPEQRADPDERGHEP